MADSRQTEALSLAVLVASAAAGRVVDELPTIEEFEGWISDLLERFECGSAHEFQEASAVTSLFSPRSARDEIAQSMARWRFLLKVSLEMAVVTYERLLRPLPPVDPMLLERFERLLGTRPDPAKKFEQAPIEPESSLRRAAEIRSDLGSGMHSVLFVGDDDATSIALALLEPSYGLWVVDIDERILEVLASAAREIDVDLRTEQLDLRSGAPFHLVGRFAGAVLDPPRWYQAEMQFLRFAARCLDRGAPSRLYWCDHPVMTPSYESILAQFPSLGLRVRKVVENLHRFEAPKDYVESAGLDPPPFGLDPRWVAALVRQSRLWSHLHVLGWSD